MNFRGTIVLGENTVVYQADGDLAPKPLPDGKVVYRGFFSTTEDPGISFDDIYRLIVEDGRRTKIKVTALLSDLAGMKVYSFYATHPLT